MYWPRASKATTKTTRLKRSSTGQEHQSTVAILII